MEYVIDAKTSKKNDQYTILNFTPSLELMERAGDGIASFIIKNYSNLKRVLIICGGGGNGGDGYVVGRKLLSKYDVTILDVASNYSKDCLTNKNKYQGKLIKEFDDSLSYDLVIDAIFGVGLNKNIEGKLFELINKINNFPSFKISVDINSGLDASNGLILGISFISDITITIQDYKMGLFLNDGRDQYKELIKLDIGIASFDEYRSASFIYSSNDFKDLFLKRKSHTNKGSYGKVCVIGGSKEFLGAPLLSIISLTPLLEGCGYSCLAFPSSLYLLYALKNLENIYFPLSAMNGEVIFKEEEISKLLGYDAIAIGMGCGTSIEIYKIITYLLKNYKNKLLIDADGLNSLATFGVDVLLDHSCEVILTPHIKEFSRLSSIDMETLKTDYIKYATEFSTKYNLYLVLKNNTTITTYLSKVSLNINGTPALAKGGSGDCLSGIILGLLTKKKDTFLEVSCGSYILGRCSELASKTINENSLLASDINKFIPSVLDEFK